MSLSKDVFFYIYCNNNLSKSVLDFPLTCSLILLFRFVIENLRALKALKEKTINCLIKKQHVRQEISQYNLI